jgi:nucleotide-binding universal stress UspA family protein
MLVVIDASEASKRVLQYIGRVLAGRKAVEIHLAYIAPGLPPALLETGGAEQPEREEQIEARMRSGQRRWVAATDKKAARILLAARDTLRRARVPASQIHTAVSSPLDMRTLADEVLLLARDFQCGTIVVGHRAHTWLRGLVGGSHLAHQLVRKAKGFAVWVID